MKTINTIIQLRRDNEFNYPTTYVPRNGEVLLIDTPTKGLQVKVGNGTSTFTQLDYYASDIIVRGYYFEDKFYSDNNHENLITGSNLKIYVDISTSKLYIYNEEQYTIINTVPYASSADAKALEKKGLVEDAGILKLYDTTGSNTDGTMTQKAITDQLNTKISVTVEEENELAIFSKI